MSEKKKDKPYRLTESVKITSDGDRGENHTHPAFGMISIGRPQGNPGRMFGSALDNVSQFIDVTIYEAEQRHDLGRNWYHARRELIRISMTPAQFAELLTTNSYGGVPCTIDHVEHKPRPAIALDHETEQSRIRSKFDEDVKERLARLEATEAQIGVLLAKKNLGQADRKQIANLVGEFTRMFSDSAPFMVESFQEAAEKMVVSAKAEVEAFVSNAIRSAGLEAIAQGNVPKLLGAAEEKPAAAQPVQTGDEES